MTPELLCIDYGWCLHGKTRFKFGKIVGNFSNETRLYVK